MSKAISESIKNNIAWESDFIAIPADMDNVGSVAVVADARGGVADIDTGTTDNDVASLATKKVFDISSNNHLRMTALAKFTKASGDTGNLFIGFSSVAMDALLADNGGGLASTLDGAGFYVIDGGTKLSVVSSIGTTKTTNELAKSNLNNRSRADWLASTSAYREFIVDVRATANGVCEINFYVDGIHVATHEEVPASSPAAVAALVGIKTGAAASETVLLDYLEVAETR